MAVITTGICANVFLFNESKNKLRYAIVRWMWTKLNMIKEATRTEQTTRTEREQERWMSRKKAQHCVKMMLHELMVDSSILIQKIEVELMCDDSFDFSFLFFFIGIAHLLRLCRFHVTTLCQWSRNKLNVSRFVVSHNESHRGWYVQKSHMNIKKNTEPSVSLSFFSVSLFSLFFFLTCGIQTFLNCEMCITLIASYEWYKNTLHRIKLKLKH